MWIFVTDIGYHIWLVICKSSIFYVTTHNDSISISDDSFSDDDMSSCDDDSDEESSPPAISSVTKLHAYCKQKARKRPIELTTESSSEGEGEGSPLQSSDDDKEGDMSEVSDVSASGFLDDEAMEVEVSDEEWAEGSGESEVDGWLVEDGEEEEEEDERGEGFIDSEALDEEVYQARKRRKPRILSDDDESISSDDAELAKKCEGTHDENSQPPTKCNQQQDSEGSSESGEDEQHSDSKANGISGESESSSPSSDEEPKASIGEKEADPSDTIGGLFQLARKKALSVFHDKDTSLVRGRIPTSITTSAPPLLRDWTDPTLVAAAKSLFVTGSWGAEGAQALLDEDDALYGDFEDMEEGEMGGRETEGRESPERGQRDEDGDKKRSEKKRKLKAAFDVGYDEEEGGASYLEDLKKEVSEQEQRNKAEFEGMDEQTRLQYEGVRPGYYVRLELKGM